MIGELMWKIFFLLVLMLFVSCLPGDNQHHSLVGAWTLEDASYTNDGYHLKLFIDYYFTTIWQAGSGDHYPGFNGGKYILKDNKYTEFHHFDHNQDNIGKKSVFRIELDHNRFTIYKLDKNGNKTDFWEKWKRAD